MEVEDKTVELSEKGRDFIASWEQGPHGGPALTEYDDGNLNWKPGEPVTGYLTIGYGHKILPGEDFSKGITKQQAEDLLGSDIKTKAITPIREYVKAPLSQQQFDALVSYVYNTGSLYHTKLLHDINNEDYTGAVKEMDINTSGGVYMQGLENRREAERNIWNKGEYVNHI